MSPAISFAIEAVIFFGVILPLGTALLGAVLRLIVDTLSR